MKRYITFHFAWLRNHPCPNLADILSKTIEYSRSKQQECHELDFQIFVLVKFLFKSWNTRPRNTKHCIQRSTWNRKQHNCFIELTVSVYNINCVGYHGSSLEGSYGGTCPPPAVTPQHYQVMDHLKSEVNPDEFLYPT